MLARRHVDLHRWVSGVDASALSQHVTAADV